MSSVNKINTLISAEHKIADLRERLPELLAHPHTSVQVLDCAQRFADYLSGLDDHPLFNAKA
ncbi:hypothetical protein KKI93_25290, partial [Xenorhabdus bovienii]|uniref:hypothetical protein n=1 Tax=Xenorhabdus bovienii TaxID=40576 RepID=UPI0023B25863